MSKASDQYIRLMQHIPPPRKLAYTKWKLQRTLTSFQLVRVRWLCCAGMCRVKRHHHTVCLLCSAKAMRVCDHHRADQAAQRISVYLGHRQ